MPQLADFCHPYNVRHFPNLAAPVMKTPVVDGAAGSTSYTYAAGFVTICGETPPSAEVTIATGPDTLNGFDRVRLEVEAVPAAVRKVRYYKRTVDGLRLLAEVDPDPGKVYDSGQAVDMGAIPTSENTSGRPQYIAIGYHPSEYRQRQEELDWECTVGRWVKDLGDTLFKDGDIVSGGVPRKVDGTDFTYTMVETVVYLYGFLHPIPEGDIALTGSGTEMVGLRVTPRWVTPQDDAVLRAAADENVAPEYAQMGADRLVLELTWVVDEVGQIDVYPFLNGEPLLKVERTERTKLEEDIEQRTFDVSGDFVVDPFPMKMIPDSDNPANMKLKIEKGTAYPQGRKTKTIAPQFPDIPRARDFLSANNAVLTAYSAPGGTAIGTTTENFDVDGLNVRFKFGSGNWHTVGLTGNGQTAAQVASQIEASINTYPTSGDLVNAVDAVGKLQVSAPEGKTLEIGAVASDAYTVLGLLTGIYEPSGQRIYPTAHPYVASVSDLQFITETVVQITHDGTDHIDDTGLEGVQDVLGCSLSEADCHDGKYDFLKNVDFTIQGNNINFAALGGSDPVNGSTYYARVRYGYNGVKGTRVRVRVIDAQIEKGAAGGEDALVFTGATSAAEVITGDPVTGLSGAVSDAIRILRVNDSPGQSQSDYSGFKLVKNSSPLKHEQSAIDWSGASSEPTTGATVYVTLEYWRHVTEGDYVASDSFLGDYDEIEYAPDSVTHLRDCLDFRCSGGKRPVPSDSPRFDYDYYVPRIDRIALKATGYFTRVPGIPAIAPVPPKARSKEQDIALIYVPPYTYSPDNCTIQSIENVRMTQQRMNELSAALDRVKYYNALFMANQQATQNTAATNAKGIFVDSLTGQGGSDVTFNKNGIKFTAAIDTKERVIRLPAAEDGRTITLNEALSSGIKKVGKVITFDFQAKTYLSQPKATGILNVNPYEAYGWIGTLECDPESDFWTDTQQLPDLVVNYDNWMAAFAELEAEAAARAREITWGSWSLGWDQSGGWAAAQLQLTDEVHWASAGSDTAKTYDQYGFQPNAARERSGTYTALIPERQLVDNGELVDRSVLPFMRQIPVELEAQGLMPNSDIGCTIDGVAVDLTPSGDTEAGVLHYQGKTTVQTSASGRATMQFTIPEGIRVGSKVIKVFSAADPDESWASCLFAAQGYLEKHQDTFLGIVSATEREEVVTQTQFHYGDPLAQSFPITEGIEWVSGARVRFQAKDANLPITCEIREMLNGQPTRRVLQTKTLYPEDIVVSDDASAVTRFGFGNIVGYTPGEYAIHLITNCATYKVWYAKMGEVDIVTGELVRAQPTGGVLFTSPNDSTWMSHPDSDLTFELETCNFTNNAQIRWNQVTGVEAGMLVAAVNQFVGPDCDLHWFYSIDGGANWIPFLLGIDTELGAIGTTVDLYCDVTGSGGTFQIDESGAGIILLLNRPSADYITAQSITEAPFDKVTLILRISSDGVNGAGTRSVTPYYSVDDGETWVELKQKVGSTPIAVGNGVFKEYTFETPGVASITGATNASPIVISSANHEFQENAVVEIADAEGNTAPNGTRRIVNVTADTLELVDPETGAPIAGNGDYTGGGTIRLAEATQLRFRVRPSTTNRALTPKIQWPVMGFAGEAA